MDRDPLLRLRDALDRQLVGQQRAKTGLLLALVARQHAYLEGPPGCGKSMLAEALGRLAGCRSVILSFHRDLRSSDLLGDPMLWYERLPTGERVRVGVVPGPVQQAEVLVLDDLARAPGEALGPLLRILADRQMPNVRRVGIRGRKGGPRRAMPLETAVATGPAETAEGYVDPLEPGQLDRFAVQVSLRGHLQNRRWPEARELVGGGMAPVEGAVLCSEERHRLQAEAAGLPIPEGVREAWTELLMRLSREGAGDPTPLTAPAAGSSARAFGLSDRAFGLSDRAFGAGAGSLLRAHARLRRGARVELEDLRVLRYMVARRLSQRLQTRLAALVEEIIQDPIGAGRQAAGPAPASASVSLGGGGQGQRAGQGSGRDDEPVSQVEPDRRPVVSAEVTQLLAALSGRIERGRNDRGEDPGGQPRGYRPQRRIDDLFEADPVEGLLLLDGAGSAGVRVFRRVRRRRAGALVLLRDTSASMAGELAVWAGEVASGVVRSAGRRQMRIGYVEFDQQARPCLAGGRLLHRRYARLLALAAGHRAAGRTNYEAPLRLALEALRHPGGARGRHRHIVMLTDGVPVVGDPEVRRERAEARRWGIAVHTVFLGREACPPVLDALSLETGGLRFAALPGPAGSLVVEERQGSVSSTAPASAPHPLR